MPKSFISKDYLALVIVAAVVAVLLLGVGFFFRNLRIGRAGFRRPVLLLA